MSAEPRASVHAGATGPTALSGRYGFPASLGQQRLRFLEEFDENAARAYQVALVYRLDCTIDRVALQRAVNDVVARHEALRTRLVRVDGDLLQVVDPEARLIVHMVDLRASSSGDPDEVLRRFSASYCRRAIRSDADHLVQVCILNLPGVSAGLLLRFNHAIVDGTSLEIFLEELAFCYDAHARGVTPSLPALPLHFADYAVWQRRWLQGEGCQALREYWRAKLAGAPQVLDLPADGPAVSPQSFEGGLHHSRLGRELSAAVRAFAGGRRVTPSTVLLTAFVSMLARFTGKSDFLVGMPVENRPTTEFERVIGFFANTVVVRAELSGDPTLADVLDRMQQTVVEAVAHQQLPFAELVNDVRPDRSVGRNPIFQVMYVYRRSASLTFDGGRLQLARVPVDSGTSKFDLTAMFADDGDDIEAQLEYDAGRFTGASARRLLRYYLAVLQALLRDPRQRLAACSLLTADEEARLLAVSRTPAFPPAPPGNVVELFERQASRTPGRIALVHGDVELSYAELNGEANRLARALRAGGVEQGDRVAILLGRSRHQVPALLAIMKAGATYVPVDPRDPSERQAAVLADCRPVACLTEHAADHPALAVAPVVDLGALDLSALSGDDLGISIHCETPAYVIYTSGSTGEPKGVVIPHRALANLLMTFGATVEMHEADVFIAPNTISFDISVPELYLPLVFGARTVLATLEEAADGYALQELIERHHVTMMEVTPSYWRMLLDLGWSPPAGFKVLCGGEPLSLELAGRLMQSGARCWNLYGPTEATVWSTQKELVPGEPLTVGRPLQNTGAYVLDDGGALMPIHCCGALYLSGANLAHGYLNRPRETAAAFVPDPCSNVPGGRLYRTGDIARYLDSGELQYVGRADSQVKIRGFRVELGEIEAAVRQHPAVDGAVATVVGADEYRSLQLFLVPRPGAVLPGNFEEVTVLPPSLRAFLARTLPEYKVPTWCVKLRQFPLTHRGKVDRHGLVSKRYARATAEGPYVAPRTELESHLARIWADVLRYDRVGVYDNFFDLGGNSLMTGYVLDRINHLYRVRVPMRELFLDATVNYVADYIRNALREREHGVAEPDAADDRTACAALLGQLTAEELDALVNDPSLTG